MHRSRKGGNPLTKLHIERWWFLARRWAPQFRYSDKFRDEVSIWSPRKPRAIAIRGVFGIPCRNCLCRITPLLLTLCITYHLQKTHRNIVSLIILVAKFIDCSRRKFRIESLSNSRYTTKWTDNASMNAIAFIFRFNDYGLVFPSWMSHLFRDTDPLKRNFVTFDLTTLKFSSHQTEHSI